MHAALSSYVEKHECYAVEWAAVRAILAAIWSSWPDLYPNSGGSRVGEQRMARCPLIGSREVLTQACTAYRSGQNGVPSRRASRGWSRCHRVWRAPARAGTAATPLQWRGWQSTGLALPPNPVGSQESESRVRRPPFEGSAR
jgi:hypothetical protein